METDETTGAELPSVAGVSVRDLVPGRVAGIELDIVEVPGESFAGDGQLAATLLAMGRTASDVSLAVALPPHESSLEFAIGSLRVEGFDWTAGVEAFAAHLREGASDSVEVTNVILAGKEVVRVVSVEEPAMVPMYYYALGDALVYAQSAEEATVAEALDPLPTAESVPAPSASPTAPPVGATDIPGLGMVVLRHLDYACVNDVDRFVFQMWYIGAHPNAMFFPVAVTVDLLPAGQRLGAADSSVAPSGITAVGQIEYRAHTAADEGEGDEVVFRVIEALNAIFGEFSTELFDVHLCLSGRWQDGPRVLEVVHRGSALSANIVEGTLRCGETGRVFTADTQIAAHGGLRLSGTDLLVCNPQSCVDEGKLPNSERVPFEGAVSSDGRTMTIEWDGQQFDFECSPTHTLRESFSISLIQIGPPRPF